MSSPPWAASMTTTKRGADGGAGAGADGGAGGVSWARPNGPRQTKTAATSTAWDCRLLQCINGEPAEQLRIKIGGLLRHDFAGERDFPHHVDVHGLCEEGHVGASALNLV